MTPSSLAVVELMRILWIIQSGQASWNITTRSCAFTNHTLLSEALEKWPVSMFEKLLPRPLQIVYEINRRFLRDVSIVYVKDEARMRRMSLIEEGEEKRIRMAPLAIVGSHSVNGVAELHTRLLREKVLKDFDGMFPGKFNNKTNGVTPRRWLLGANPELAEFISEHIGREWIWNFRQLRELEPLIADAQFRRKWQEIKHRNKERFALLAKKITGVSLDPNSVFDFQVKRIHEYKRQLLNILHVVYCWLKLKREPDFKMVPRTFIFGGKAAPAYATAKLIIRLICHAAEMINRDSSVSHILKVLFIPNYRVSLAERIFPSADISEQISTAGYEASGTSNMKFAMNGALTVGTLDGANIEIMEEVGEENIFIFGLSADEVSEIRKSYHPHEYYQNDPVLKDVIDLIRDDFFNPEEPGIFRPLVDSLLARDDYLVLADFAAYHACQMRTDALYRDQDAWTRKAILNVARMGRFSSDRTILEYNRDIWKTQPMTIEQEEKESAE
ncbi:MAG: glycogen/starch/alpha-glucan family phosphorylase [Desulfobacterales bacterium]